SAVTIVGVRLGSDRRRRARRRRNGLVQLLAAAHSGPAPPSARPSRRATADAPQPTLLAVDASCCYPAMGALPSFLDTPEKGPGGLRVSRWAGYSRPNGTRARALWRSAACRMPADLERSALLAVIQSGLRRCPLLAVIQSAMRT